MVTIDHRAELPKSPEIHPIRYKDLFSIGVDCAQVIAVNYCRENIIIKSI